MSVAGDWVQNRLNEHARRLGQRKRNPVMSEANAPIPAVQSGAVAWRYRRSEEHEWEYEDHSPQHTPWAVRRMRATAFPHYEALYLAAPQSEPLPGGVGEREKVAQALYEASCLVSPPVHPWAAMTECDRDIYREEADRFNAIVATPESPHNPGQGDGG